MAGMSRADRWAGLLKQAEQFATVENVFGHGGKRSGKNMLFMCPFHAASDQSDPKGRRLSVNPQTLAWRCWHSSCAKTGNALAYINGGIKPTGQDYKRAVVALADRVGVQVPAPGA